MLDLDLFIKTKTNALKSSVQLFIDARGLLLIERKGMHYVEVYICREQYFVFICQLSPESRRYFPNFIYYTSSLLCCILHWWMIFLTSLTQNNGLKVSPLLPFPENFNHTLSVSKYSVGAS